LPEIARLGSIIIRVYADDARRHHQPHFHAVDPDQAIVVSLPGLTIIAGELRRSRDVIAWARLSANLSRLIEAWNHGNPDRQIRTIAP
jgi:hypothetical protein